jgi:LuxR family maltose regulon positive regulatory protein
MADLPGRQPRRRVPRTKLAVPQVPQVVSRPRLLSMLDTATDAMVTLVCASAGSGKTVLLAEWVRGRSPADTAWVSLDSDDNEDGRFWSALLDALSGCDSVPVDSPLRRLTLPASPSSDPRFLAEVVNALDDLPTTVWLILDDVHELTNPQPLHGLEILLRHNPARLRLVLSARHDPQLPLGRLRVADQLAEVRAEDLRFSPKEARVLLEAAGIDLDPDQLARLVAQTEGWGAGLRLAVLSLSETGEPGRFLDDFAANDRAVGEYLIDEVLSRLPDAMSEFLATISVCERVSVDLAAELSGRADAGALLDALTHRTSLVIRVEAAQQWFHVHALLRSHLLAELTRSAPERAARLHGIAAGWFAARDQPARALAHGSQAGDARLAGELARRYATTLVLGGDHELIRNLLDVLGDRLIAEDSQLALVSALLHLELGEPDVAERDLASAEAAWPARPPAGLRTLRQLVRSRRAQVGGDIDELMRTTEDLDSGSGAEPMFDALARLQRGTALLAASSPEPAREHLEAARRTARECGYEYLETQAVTMLGALAAVEGDYRAMVALAGEANDRNTRRGWQRTVEAATACALLGYGALLRADPRECLRQTARAGQFVDEGDPPVNQGLSLVVETLRGAAEFELGHWAAGARRILRAQIDAGDDRVSAQQVALTGMLGHRAALLLGWPQAAGQLLHWAQATIPVSGEVHVMRARAQLVLGRHDAACKIIRPVLEGSAPAVIAWTLIEAYLLQCEAALSAETGAAARRALRKAMLAAQRVEVLHPLVFASAGVVDLMTGQLGKLGAVDQFAHRAHAIRGMLRVPPMPVPLTPRERGILHLLPTLRSLDEIAEDLMVSPNTVKTHVRAIYTKLGVTRRRDAVEVATERGLLESEQVCRCDERPAGETMKSCHHSPGRPDSTRRNFPRSSERTA